MNLGDGHSQSTERGVCAVLRSGDDDAVDLHLERIRNAAVDESDEQDEGFVADKDAGGSSTDNSGEEASHASDTGNEKERKEKKDVAMPKPSASGKKKSKDGEEEGTKKRKQKKKRDPNAPKRALSGFMFFSQAERGEYTEGNPGISFLDIGRLWGSNGGICQLKKKNLMKQKPGLTRNITRMKLVGTRTCKLQMQALLLVDLIDSSLRFHHSSFC